MANSYGQLGPDFQRFLWGVADHAARSKNHLSAHDLPIPDGVNALGLENASAVVSCKRLRNRLYHDYILRFHRDVLEAVTSRLFGKSFALRDDVNYRAVQEHRSAMWQPNCAPAHPVDFSAADEDTSFDLPPMHDTPERSTLLVSGVAAPALSTPGSPESFSSAGFNFTIGEEYPCD